jgi:hypothetical protein
MSWSGCGAWGLGRAAGVLHLDPLIGAAKTPSLLSVFEIAGR